MGAHARLGAPHRTAGGALTREPGRGIWRRRLLAAVSAERGALLWIPGLLVASYLLFFAVRVAPTGLSMFTRTTGLRIAIGPCTGGATVGERAAFVGALRRGLAPRGDVVVVDSLRVARALGPLGPSPDEAGILRALRPLNPHLGLVLALESVDGGFAGALVAWDVHEQSRRLRLEARGATPEEVGRTLAADLHGLVFEHATAAPR